MKKSHFKVCVSFCLLISFYSCAQENKNQNFEQNKASKTEIHPEESFYDALRFRTDLRLNANKRILYTSIENIEEFDQKYKETDMTLNHVIRDRLHTAIFLNQKKNHLKSIDGSEFCLSQNLSAQELTDRLVSLIGSMYYGADEVKALVQ